MRLFASIMTEVPFSDNLVIALVSFVIIGSLIVAFFVVRDILKERRNTELQKNDHDLKPEHFKHTETDQQTTDNKETPVPMLL